MNTFALNQGLYIHVTPRGAYFAVQDNADDPTRNILIALLLEEETPFLSIKNAEKITGIRGEDAFNFLYKMQTLGLISGEKESEMAPENSLETILPELLGSLSDSKKGLLAEHSGLYLGASGFPHEAAEELAAISANLSEVYQRHKKLLQDNLNFNQHAWGLIDATGKSEVGFWPLYIGYNQFTLVIHGIPQLNRVEFKLLIWSLVKRYGKL